MDCQFKTIKDVKVFSKYGGYEGEKPVLFCELYNMELGGVFPNCEKCFDCIKTGELKKEDKER